MLLFVIVSFQGSSPLPLFYKYFHNDDRSENQQSPDTSGETKKTRKTNIQRVVERLYSMFQFQQATNARSLEAELQVLNSDNVVPELEIGHFKMLEGDPFYEEMRVIWTSVNGLGVAFVCYGYENRVQAEITLCVLVRKLHESCRCILQPHEILNKPEKVEILLSKFVPYGQPLLMNHRVIRQLEKEAEALLKTIVS